MANNTLLNILKKKSVGILIDPDYISDAKENINNYFNSIKTFKPDILLIGGSLLTNGNLDLAITMVKNALPEIPVLIFPGNNLQISDKADGLLYLSLISGRNADYLIGQHVLSSFKVKQSGVEVIPTGYILIQCGTQTTAEYISNTTAIPYSKNAIAAATALAGQLLGLKTIYLDGGSGADKTISTSMIETVKKSVEIPIIVGGGVASEEDITQLHKAGANMVVIGTSFENFTFKN